MSLTSNGLSNLQGLGVGQTTNFIVQIENTLSNQANIIANADALLAVLENEFTVTTGLVQYAERQVRRRAATTGRKPEPAGHRYGRGRH